MKRLWRRVGETIRKYDMFREGEDIYIAKEGKNARALASILQEMGYEFGMVNGIKDVPEGGVLAVGNLLEDEVADVIWGVLNWEISESIMPIYQEGKVKVVKPLCLLIEEELLHYRNIKSIIEEGEARESGLKKKIKEKGLLSAGFWLTFYKSFLRGKDELKLAKFFL